MSVCSLCVRFVLFILIQWLYAGLNSFDRQMCFMPPIRYLKEHHSQTIVFKAEAFNVWCGVCAPLNLPFPIDITIGLIELFKFFICHNWRTMSGVKLNIKRMLNKTYDKVLQTVKSKTLNNYASFQWRTHTRKQKKPNETF